MIISILNTGQIRCDGRYSGGKYGIFGLSITKSFTVAPLPVVSISKYSVTAYEGSRIAFLCGVCVQQQTVNDFLPSSPNNSFIMQIYPVFEWFRNGLLVINDSGN